MWLPNCNSAPAKMRIRIFR